jgi:hypothetical protein
MAACDVSDRQDFPGFVLNWQDEERHDNDAELDPSPGAGGGVPICRRHKLEVNFADIGWSHWIISPQTFEAHYCAGSCPYPLTKVCKVVQATDIASAAQSFPIQGGSRN